MAADEHDLDRRFDHIMDKVTHQPQPHLPHPRSARRVPARRRLFAQLATSTLAGAGVAVAGGATRLMAGVVNFVVVTVAVTVAAFAVTAVGDHYVARHKRIADTEQDNTAPGVAEWLAGCGRARRMPLKLFQLGDTRVRTGPETARACRGRGGGGQGRLPKRPGRARYRAAGARDTDRMRRNEGGSRRQGVCSLWRR